jgi:hypothetical protein
MGLSYIVGKAVKQTGASLGSKLKSPILQPLTYTKSDAGMIARLRELAVAEQSMTKAAYAALRTSVTVMVADFLEREARVKVPGGDRTPFWRNLNATPAEVARVYVELVGANPKGVLSHLPRGPGAKAGTGREGAFNGWLFQRYALNHVELHRDLRAIARGHVADLNQRLGTSSGLLFDPHEVGLDLRGRFGRPQRATDFWLSARRKAKTPTPLADVDPEADYVWEEFMDCAYVSPLIIPQQKGIVYWTIAVGLEVKRPAAAAADLSRQVGEMLGRMQDSDILQMSLDGSQNPLKIPTRAFVFVPESRWLVGATRSLANAPEYDFVGSESGGYPETYLRMRIRFDTGPIDRLSSLLFRAVL